MKIYWGITASRSYGKVIPSDKAVLISAGGLWNGKGFINKRTLIWPDIALDSGGFVALNKWGDYPFTPDQYLDFIERMNPVWAASMDYPCEAGIAKGSKLTINERIAATVEYAVYLCSKDERITPVLQGYEPKDYEQCWNILSANMQVKRLAIGTLCKRQSTKEIADLSWAFRQFLPRIPVHGFGLKLRALEHPEVWGLFTSIDTDAWEAWKRWEQCGGNKMTDAQAWNIYFDKTEILKAKPRQLVF